jgi:hypothetical protein
MSLKSFFLKRMLKSKMKDVPEEQQEKILAAIEKNPDFFQKIALEVQEKIKSGKDQMTATMEVMQNYQEEMKNIMQ